MEMRQWMSEAREKRITPLFFRYTDSPSAMVIAALEKKIGCDNEPWQAEEIGQDRIGFGTEQYCATGGNNIWLQAQQVSSLA